MKKLENISFSLIDYEGALNKFRREGQGTQQWGNFCTLEGVWKDDLLVEHSIMKFPHFPIQADLLIQQKRINQTKFVMDLMKFDVMFDGNFSIQSGIIDIDEGLISIHFVCEDQKIESFEILRNNQILDSSKHREEDQIYRVYCNDKKNKFIEINLKTHSITLVKYGSNGQLFGTIPQFSAQQQQLHLFNYEQGMRKGQQMKLSLASKVPFVCVYYLEMVHAVDRYYYADGSNVFKESNGI